MARLKQAALLALGSSLGMAVAVLGPAALHIPPCPFFGATGLLCPGCGSLRSLHNLWLGNFGTAWQSNALAVSLLPVLFALVLGEIFFDQRTYLRRGMIGTLLIAIIGFGIIRNFPPMSHLRPAKTAAASGIPGLSR